jgi:CspA family cold shock protein
MALIRLSSGLATFPENLCRRACNVFRRSMVSDHFQAKILYPWKGKDLMRTEGLVKFFNVTKGFGFIEPTNGQKDVFVHISEVERSGLQNLKEGDKVSFEIEADKRGRSNATKLQIS